MKAILGDPMPEKWISLHEDIIAEGGLKIPGSKLQAKLIVFLSPQGMRSFWKTRLGRGELGKNARGVVSALAYHQYTYSKDGKEVQSSAVYDPKYYCVIGLCLSHLTMNIVCHEAVHAAYAFVKRAKRTPWSFAVKHFDEEEIAYPTGMIAAAMNSFLFKHNLYVIAETFERYKTK